MTSFPLALCWPCVIYCVFFSEINIFPFQTYTTANVIEPTFKVGLNFLLFLWLFLSHIYTKWRQWGCDRVNLISLRFRSCPFIFQVLFSIILWTYIRCIPHLKYIEMYIFMGNLKRFRDIYTGGNTADTIFVNCKDLTAI